MSGGDLNGTRQAADVAASPRGFGFTDRSLASSEWLRGGPTPCVLLVLVSCASHAEQWPLLRQWADSATVGACGTVVTLTAARARGGGWRVPSYDAGQGLLVVGGSDAWDHLPEKILRMFHAFASLNPFQGYDYLMKLDDTKIAGVSHAAMRKEEFDIAHLLPADWSLRRLEEHLQLLAATPQGRRKLDYCGPAIEEAHSERLRNVTAWHIINADKVPLKCPGNYYCNHLGRANATIPAYAHGGYSYMSSKRAAKAIAEATSLEPSALTALYYSDLYEDLKVGEWHEAAGFHPATVRLLNLGLSPTASVGHELEVWEDHMEDPWGYD